MRHCLPLGLVAEFNATKCGGVLDDVGALDAALSAPLQTFGGCELYPGVYGRAAKLLEGIARLHPFRDGNKRTAWWACVTFLAAHGVRVVADPVEGAGRLVMGVVLSRVSVEEAARWLEEHAGT